MGPQTRRQPTGHRENEQVTVAKNILPGQREERKERERKRKRKREREGGKGKEEKKRKTLDINPYSSFTFMCH